MIFSECFYKIWSSQNCSRFRPHRVMFFKKWKIAKIREISSIFHKISENFDFHFCTNHERSNFGIKKSDFFFSKMCQKLSDFYDFFKMLLQKKLVEPKLQPIEATQGDVF